MVKDCHQLLLSLRIGCGLLVATLASGPGINSLLAGGDEPAVAYHHSDGGAVDSYAHGIGPHVDTSCEPSFRGGDCENCCLDLWQGYCAERTCCHSHSLRHFGCGYLRLGCLLGKHRCGAGVSHCATGSCGRGNCATGGCANESCSCHSSSAGVTVSDPPTPTQPQVIDDAATTNASVSLEPQPPAEGAFDTQAAAEADEATDIVPPSNPLPPTPAPRQSEPLDDAIEESNPAAAEVPPAPPSIDFSVEPGKSARTPLTTVSAKPNAGTTRLLRQLRAN